MVTRKFLAFTLIELLVVVAIIGILAAVGVVAYNGYTGAAKVSVTKANHNNMVKKVSLVIQMCNLSGSVSMMSKPNNKTLYDITCYLPNNRVFFTDYLFNDMNNLDTCKNPFVTTATGDVVLQSGWCKYATNGGQVGYVWVNGRDNMDHVTVCTCTKIPCNGSNVSENKIYLD